jgi:hypothetical protein
MVFLTSCTLSGNSAPVNGGALYNPIVGGSAGDVYVGNCLVAGNSAANGPDAQGLYISQGYNLVGKTNGTTGLGVVGDQMGSVASPLDPRLGALQNNGGPAPTFALRSDSPALDHGQSFGLRTDLRGRLRKVHLPFILTNGLAGGDRTDIGAFESQPLPLLITGIHKAGTNAMLTFKSESGWSYDVEGKTNLGAMPWTTVLSNTPGSPAYSTVSNLINTSAQKFYRVRLRP